MYPGSAETIQGKEGRHHEETPDRIHGGGDHTFVRIAIAAGIA
jgi:hypothetical protein